MFITPLVLNCEIDYALTYIYTHETFNTIKIINISITLQSFIVRFCNLSFLPSHPHADQAPSDPQTASDMLSFTID